MKSPSFEPSRLQRGLTTLTTQMALAGAAGFCLLVAMSLVSIVGRKLFAAPVTGDVELMQMGSAVAACAFLPYCALHGHNLRVDALTTWLPKAGQAALDALAQALLALCMGVIAWRTLLATLDAHASHEVSSLLGIPLWLPMAAMVPSLAMVSVAALFCLCVPARAHADMPQEAM